MRKYRMLAVLAGGVMATAAGAEVNTSIVWQLSSNGVSWTSSMGGVPGATYYARAVVSYTGTAAPLGLASLAFQPTVSNWSVTNTLQPFVNGGQGGNTSTPVGVVMDPNSTSVFGRLAPWGRSALSATNFLRGHTHIGGSGGAPTGNWLRIAQNQATSWMGGAGNTTGGAGVPISQLNDVGRTSSDPAFNSSLQNIVVFKYAFTLSDQGSGVFSWVIDSPIAGMGNYNAATGEREVYWFASMTETTGSIRGAATVSSATIILPSPAGVGALFVAGVFGCVRRRR